MLIERIYVVPFFVVGRRMSLTIELRYRSLSRDDTGDNLIFDFDSQRDQESYQGLPDLCERANQVILRELTAAKERGWPLTKKQQAFVARKSASISWLFDCGYGEQASVPSAFFEELIEMADE